MLRNYIIILLECFIALILLFELFYVQSALSTGFLIKILVYVAVSSVLFSLRDERQAGLRSQHLKISNLFLLGFVIVHFQIYLDYVLGAYHSFNVDLMINERLVPKASLISTLALVIYYIGYLLASYYKTGVSRLKNQQISKVIYSPNGILILMLVLLALFLYTANWNYFKGNYGEMTAGTLADYAQQYLLLAMIGYIVLSVRNNRIKGRVFNNLLSYIKSMSVPFLVISGIYLFLVLISGDRGPILQFGLSLIGGYILLARRKIRLIVVVLGLVVGATAISLLGFVREIGSSSDFIDKVGVAYSMRQESRIQSSISPSTMELAGSVRTMHAAVDYANSNGHTNGLFQLFQALSIIPGAGTIVKAFTGLENTDFKSSAYLTRHILGNTPDRGLGTTVVADIFLDFGIIGVVIIFFLFAWFVRYLEVNVFTAHFFKISTLALFFIFLSQAIYIGRSTILVLFKDALLIYIIVLIGLFINSFLGYKKGEVAAR